MNVLSILVDLEGRQDRRPACSSMTCVMPVVPTQTIPPAWNMAPDAGTDAGPSNHSALPAMQMETTSCRPPGSWLQPVASAHVCSPQQSLLTTMSPQSQMMSPRTESWEPGLSCPEQVQQSSQDASQPCLSGGMDPTNNDPVPPTEETPLGSAPLSLSGFGKHPADCGLSGSPSKTPREGG